ncbi:MAG TPA: metal-dependent hydrolase [Pyrinomonadaceae bacterium]|nr:metal-dependent hydrolase [Pyrinomonadaceae bacterium]
MPLPVAHALVGATLNNSFSKSPRALSFKAIFLSIVLALCPDFDYGLNVLRVAGGGWHHGFTHSFLFAFAIGFACWLILKDRRPTTLMLLCAIVASHTLLDYLFTESQGVALFWPITDHRYKLNWFNPINYTMRTRPMIASALDLARICALELLLFGPLFLVGLLVRKRWAQ